MKLSTGIFKDLEPAQQELLLNQLTKFIQTKVEGAQAPARRTAIDRFLKPLTDAVNKHKTAEVVSTTTPTPPSTSTSTSTPPPPSTSARSSTRSSSSTSAPSTTGIQASPKGKGHVKHDPRKEGPYWNKERLQAAGKQAKEKQAKARNQNQAGVELQNMGGRKKLTGTPGRTKARVVSVTRNVTRPQPPGVRPSAVTGTSEAKEARDKAKQSGVTVSVQPRGGKNKR